MLIQILCVCENYGTVSIIFAQSTILEEALDMTVQQAGSQYPLKFIA